MQRQVLHAQTIKMTLNLIPVCLFQASIVNTVDLRPISPILQYLFIWYCSAFMKTLPSNKGHWNRLVEFRLKWDNRNFKIEVVPIKPSDNKYCLHWVENYPNSGTCTFAKLTVFPLWLIWWPMTLLEILVPIASPVSFLLLNKIVSSCTVDSCIQTLPNINARTESDKRIYRISYLFINKIHNSFISLVNF